MFEVSTRMTLRATMGHAMLSGARDARSIRGHLRRTAVPSRDIRTTHFMKNPPLGAGFRGGDALCSVRV
jgi:hypothetical protein